MTTENFINQLQIRLAGIPKTDLENTIGFYREIIQDKKDEGLTDEQIIEQLEPIDKIVNEILDEYNIGDLVNEKIKAKTTSISTKHKVIIAILVILSLPITLPLAVSLLSLIMSIIFVVLLIPIILFLIFIALAFTVIIGTIGFIISLFTGNYFMALNVLGITSVSLGIILIIMVIYSTFGKKFFNMLMKPIKYLKSKLAQGGNKNEQN